jgi:hypothetical protein
MRPPYSIMMNPERTANTRKRTACEPAVDTLATPLASAFATAKDDHLADVVKKAASSGGPRCRLRRAGVPRLASFAMSQRTRRVGSWFWWIVALLVFFGAGFWCLRHGGYALWVQHSGTPASVETTRCKAHHGKASGWLPYECTGVWRQTDGSDRTVTVHGVPRYGPHQILDVHIRGDQAYTNSVREGWGNFLGGIFLLVLGIMALLPSRWLPWRRSRALRSDDPGMPSGP